MTTEGPEPVTRLLTPRELSERLGLPRWRILALVRSGSLPHFKIGRLYHYEADQIARWIEEQSRRSA